MNNIPGTLELIVIQLGKVFEPLETRLSSGKIIPLFAELGIQFPTELEAQPSFMKALDDASTSSSQLYGLFKALTSVIQDGKSALIVEKGAELINAFNNIHNNINAVATELNNLSGVLPGIDPVDISSFASQLPEKLLTFLFIIYLENNFPILSEILEFIGVIERVEEQESSIDPSKPPYIDRTLHFERIIEFLRSPWNVLQSIYGWGSPEFDGTLMLERLDQLLAFSGLPVLFDKSSVPQKLDLIILEISPKTTISPPGISIVFKADINSQSQNINVQGGRLELGLNFQVPVETELIIQPNANLTFITPTKLTEGKIFLNWAGEPPAPDQPFPILGKTRGSWLEAKDLNASVAVELKWDTSTNGAKGELNAEAEIKEGKILISPDGADGFLSRILPSDGFETDFDIVLGFSGEKGFYIKGGSDFEYTVIVNKSFGPIFINTFDLEFKATEDNLTLITATTGGAKIGPIIAVVQEFGLQTILDINKPGLLGSADLSIGFKPPTAIGLSVNAEGITGGGFLCIDPPNYAGVMELSFQNEIDLAAFGLITTKLPDGKPGFSLVIQILAEFQPIQLGLGFALTGVGGLIGINRQINETNLRDAIKNHTFDLFPRYPITDAFRLIGTIESVLPAKEGFHVFGPMAKIFWGGSVKLVEFEVGIFIEIGGPTRVALIGRAWSILPSEEIQRLALNVDVFGIIDFGDERIALDANLFDSKILRYPLDGQMALRADWSEGEENFALSVGGFYPRFYAIPPGFPTLRRLMVSVGSGNPRLTLSMYLAITTNTLQVGAQLDLWAKKAGFTITGGAGFDALIIFSPFSFLVMLNIWVNVKRGRIELGVSLELELSGPNPIIAVGFAKFKVGWFTKRVRFRKEFGDRIDEPLPVVSPLAVLKTELENPRSIRFKLPDWASANLIFTVEAESRIDPVAEIIIDQDAVPLDLTMDRFGGGTPPPAENKLNITAGLGVDQEHPTTSLFAPNQFKNWSEEQRLSAKPFEKFKSGIRMGGDWVIPEDDIEERCIGFETVVRESKDYRAAFPAYAIEAALDRFTCIWQPQDALLLTNWSLFGSGAYFEPLRKTADKTNPDYIHVVEPAYTLAGDETENGQSGRLSVGDTVAGDMTFAEALDLAGQFKGSNVTVRNTVDVGSMVL